MSFLKFKGSNMDKVSPEDEQQCKINEVRKLLGPLTEESASFCSDASISRFLRANNWDSKKASKMLKETVKWRLAYKPHQIRWEDIAQEAETGKLYIANYIDKKGRTVIVLRPGFQSSKSRVGQIKFLVYSLENAIYSMAPSQDDMVWLIDFTNWNLSSSLVKVMEETTCILKYYYPERLALTIVYNPPKVFQSFWKIVKPWLSSKATQKVRFVHSNDPGCQKIMEDLFDKEMLESALGTSYSDEFCFKAYAERMKKEEKFANQKLDVLISLPGQQPSLESVVEEPEM
ncbi:hypothetical protein H6P81_002982 [Aristolochia fimbriata]|uniref:CRAL-TRIO domain-containing protein n=1 Tax=Aristolochia fimbriata TaxID=158543 RepID=A0AAV7FBV4_ARIFI|nr:hypothetical protein H6P81_002982 [Aristolochia fimbriata]